MNGIEVRIFPPVFSWEVKPKITELESSAFHVVGLFFVTKRCCAESLLPVTGRQIASDLSIETKALFFDIADECYDDVSSNETKSPLSETVMLEVYIILKESYAFAHRIRVIEKLRKEIAEALSGISANFCVPKDRVHGGYIEVERDGLRRN